MATVCRTFWVARRGNSPAEYEDASAADDAAGRYALADGASESCFARLWARLLVEHFVAGADLGLDGWPESLRTSQTQWDAEVRAQTLHWYAERGVEQGAFATFLGIVLRARSKGSHQWQAIAVGDTCLMHTRGDALLRAFPLDRAGQFDNVPKLVGSRMGPDQIRERQDRWIVGHGRPGDRLWAMTDALAQWCLAEHEAGADPWGELETLLTRQATDARFAAWIERLRDAGRLRNDDVTLLVIPL